ncbi:hypothetical protein [Streptomyces gobiensis]|uniref:hypothetical protein n=1 Tax=Streptomyces gobiensis TaxID=2875706 RepID=UPI001E56B270|nr:hypothetical protein [Streptomyces gobiensis]UGY93980.1 hypothetical protein test1122_21205 [Streptomyces gobiensis]
MVRKTAVTIATGLVLTLSATGVNPAAAQPSAVASPGAQTAVSELPLDLPLANANGEFAGGVHPDLPTDLPTLERLLKQARAQNIEPSRYAALLWQHWLVRAVNNAGVRLNTWDPARGVDGNEHTVYAVYAFYGELFLRHPELEWAGMANMIGAAFAAGFLDLDSVGDLGTLLYGKVRELPYEVRESLPPELLDLTSEGTELSPVELRWFENKFLAMQKNIFMDLGSMHMAYLHGGIDAIEEMRSAGLIDAKAVGAWRDIATGEPARVSSGNTALLDREQNQIISGQWDQMYRRHAPVGSLLTYGMTVGGSASIPGAKTPGQYSPLRVTTPVTGVRLTTPLPDFNLADKERRWQYITEDTLPAYQNLLRHRPGEVRRIISSPFEGRVAEERLSARWPEVAGRLITGWHLDRPAVQAAHPTTPVAQR